MKLPKFHRRGQHNVCGLLRQTVSDMVGHGFQLTETPPRENPPSRGYSRGGVSVSCTQGVFLAVSYRTITIRSMHLTFMFE